jgi:hypothetical protein
MSTGVNSLHQCFPASSIGNESIKLRIGYGALASGVSTVMRYGTDV